MNFDLTWLMERSALEQLLERIVAFEPSASQFKAFFDRREAAQLYTRDGDTAVIKVEGPLFAEENIWSWLFGGSTYAVIQKALKTAESDPLIRQIKLDIDSPGGEVTGCQETAQLLAGLSKPTLSYARGLCASAAYWVGSHANRIEAAPTALLGSIGVMMAMSDYKSPDRYVFTASQSPHKNAAPSSEEGRSQYQQIVDDLAAVFIAAVASARGVDEGEVIARYGAGAVMVAARALEAGLIDGIGDGGAMSVKGGAPGAAAQTAQQPQAAQQQPQETQQQPQAAQPQAAQMELTAALAENARLQAELAAAQTAKLELTTALEAARAAQAKAEAAQKAQKKASDVAQLIREGRITPSEKAGAEMAWDIEHASADAPKMFTTAYGARPKNGAVPLAEVGHGGEAPAATKQSVVAQARERVKAAKAEGRELTMEQAIEQVEASA